MTVKNAIKYRYRSRLFMILMYYIVILLAQVGKTVAMRIYGGYTFYGEMIITSVCFLMMVGYASYKSDIKMLMQNGFSRKTVYLSFLGFLPLAVVQAVADNLICRLQVVEIRRFSAESEEKLLSVLDNLFDSSVKLNLQHRLFLWLLLAAAVYTTAMSLGYLTASIAYSLSHTQRAVALTVIVIVGAMLIFSLYVFPTEASEPLIIAERGINKLRDLIIVLLVLTAASLPMTALVGRKAEIKS